MEKTQNDTTVESSPWLTPEEAATYLRLFDKDGNPNISYLYKHACSRLIKPFKLGKFNRYRREDLDSLLSNGE